MSFNDIGSIVLWLAVSLVPISVIVGAVMALFEWLTSKLPKNAQAVLREHEAQIRRIVETVVTAVEQRIPYEPNDVKKKTAMDKINQILIDHKVPETSVTWINAMVEEMVAKLPETYDHTEDAPEPEPSVDNSKATSWPNTPLFSKAQPAPKVQVPPGYELTQPMAAVPSPLGATSDNSAL